MTVNAFDHLNIRTEDIAGTVAFFRDLLDLSPGFVGGVESMKDRGAWLLDEEGRPIVHVGAAANVYPTDHATAFQEAATGPVHHIAFLCNDYEGMRDRIAAQGHVMVEHEVKSIGQRQLFVRAPGGLVLELKFKEELQSEGKKLTSI